MDLAPAEMAPGLRDAYLRRLGCEVAPPSSEVLAELMRSHVQRVPYETMWIHMGDLWTVDPTESSRRIATTDRGGYCYHLNGAFSALLASLGYNVQRHVGGVHGPEGPDPTAFPNHLVLTVHDLPSDSNPAGNWYVDVGLGDALYEPLPLRDGDFRQGPFSLALLQNAPDDISRVGDWHMQRDPAGAFSGMNWMSSAAVMRDFAERHLMLSTSPESNFAKVALAMRRDATGVDIMRGLALARLGDGVPTALFLTERTEWFAALADIFGLTFAHSAPEMLDTLWVRAYAAHEAWTASQ